MSKHLSLAILVAACCALSGCQKQTGSAQPATPSPLVAKSVVPTAPRIAAKTYDGPFGLAGSMPVAELTQLDFKVTEFDPTVFTGKVPKPVEGVDEYTVVATQESGVCRVIGRANVPVVNGPGDQVKAKVDQFAELMATKYGKHSSKYDMVGQDVYRRNPEFWMMALKEDSAVYAYEWKAGKTAQALPEDLASIEITALAVETGRAWASIKYTFKNFDACKKDSQKRKASSL